MEKCFSYYFCIWFICLATVSAKMDIGRGNFLIFFCIFSFDQIRKTEVKIKKRPFQNLSVVIHFRPYILL